MENRKTSPCSPRAPNLLHVLPSRMVGRHNLCSPGQWSDHVWCCIPRTMDSIEWSWWFVNISRIFQFLLKKIRDIFFHIGGKIWRWEGEGYIGGGEVYDFYHFCSQSFWLCWGICPLLVKVPIGKPVKQSNPERHLPHVKDLCPPWWLLKWAKRYFIFIQIGELPTANATWGCLELRSFREKNFYHFWKLKCLKETDKLKLSLLCFSFANVWWQW